MIKDCLCVGWGERWVIMKRRKNEGRGRRRRRLGGGASNGWSGSASTSSWVGWQGSPRSHVSYSVWIRPGKGTIKGDKGLRGREGLCSLISHHTHPPPHHHDGRGPHPSS